MCRCRSAGTCVWVCVCERGRVRERESSWLDSYKLASFPLCQGLLLMVKEQTKQPVPPPLCAAQRWRGWQIKADLQLSGPVKATRARTHSARTESETQTQRVAGEAVGRGVRRRKRGRWEKKRGGERGGGGIERMKGCYWGTKDTGQKMESKQKLRQGKRLRRGVIVWPSANNGLHDKSKWLIPYCKK